MGLAQQAVDMLSTSNVGDYLKVRVAILQTLNLSPEACRRQLCEIEFGPDYHSLPNRAKNQGGMPQVVKA